MFQLDARGRIVTAEVSFAERGAAAVAAKTFHGVSVRSKKGKEKFRLKVAVLDQTQQPGAVEQIEEDDIPSKPFNSACNATSVGYEIAMS